MFHSLLEGVLDLPHVSFVPHHEALLKKIRNKLRSSKGLWQRVQFNGVPLTKAERKEVETRVQNIHVGDGYLCGASDPLLVAYCAVFNVDVDLEMAGHRHMYTVPKPVRVVVLRSSSHHMTHCDNRSPPHTPPLTLGAPTPPQ